MARLQEKFTTYRGVCQGRVPVVLPFFNSTSLRRISADAEIMPRCLGRAHLPHSLETGRVGSYPVSRWGRGQGASFPFPPFPCLLREQVANGY